MSTMPIYGKKKKKTLKNLLQNQESFEADLGIQDWGHKVYQVDSNDDSRLTLIFLWQGQICIPILLYGENVVIYSLKMY